MKKGAIGISHGKTEEHEICLKQFSEASWRRTFCGSGELACVLYYEGQKLVVIYEITK